MLDPSELISARRGLGLTKEALARVLGVGASSIQRWERGDTGPTGPVLQFYRAALSALSRGHTSKQILGDVAGDPGRVLARVFSLGFPVQEGDDV